VRSAKNFKGIKTEQILACLETLERDSLIYRTGEYEWKSTFS